MMKLDDQKIMVCNCGGSMDIDAKKLAKACGAAGGCEVATELCRGQIDRFEATLQDTWRRVADCRLHAGRARPSNRLPRSLAPVPDFINIREAAGWSDDSAAALPKIAALIRAATDAVPAARSLTLTSAGRCLIYADGSRGNGVDAAMDLAGKLKSSLGVTVMISNAGNDIMPSGDSGLVTRGTIRNGARPFHRL